MYNIGDKIVHLNHGLGTIQSIETREFNGRKQSFYIIIINDNGTDKKIFVPINASQIKLRTLITKDQAYSILQKLKTYEGESYNQTWNTRYRRQMQKINSGDFEQIGEVFKELLNLYNQKELSFGERKMFEHSLNLLTNELCTILNQPDTWVQNLLFKTLEKN